MSGFEGGGGGDPNNAVSVMQLRNLLNGTPKLYTADQVRDSPSRVDGITEVLEDAYRRKTCLFVKAAGKALELPKEAIATALVYFHKFFMLHSFQKHERFVIASACLFLAAKVEESAKRTDTTVSQCYEVWTNGEKLHQNEKPFKRLREKVLIAERCLLHTIGFLMSVEHPYSHVTKILAMLFEKRREAGAGAGSRSTNATLNRQLYQASVSLVNDSFLTTVCLQYRPYDVAAAVVYLAHLLVSLPRVDVGSLNTNESVVMAICDTILSLYDLHGGGHSTAVVSSIREALDRRMQESVSVSVTTPTDAPTVISAPALRSPASQSVKNRVTTPGAGSGAGEGDGNPHERGAGAPISRGEESTDPRDARARDEAGTGWEQRKGQQLPPRSPQPSPVVPPPPPPRPLPLRLQQRSGAVEGPTASSQETPPLPPVTSPGAGAGSGAREGGRNPHEGGAATPTFGEEESRDPQDARARDEAGTGWEERKEPQQQQPRSVQPSPVVPPPPPSRPLPLGLQQQSGAVAGPTASSQETPPLPPVTSSSAGAGSGAGEGGRNPHEGGAATPTSGEEERRDPQDARARDEAGTGWEERKEPQQQQPRSVQPPPVVPPPPPSRPLPLGLQQRSGAVAGPTASSQETPPLPPVTSPGSGAGSGAGEGGGNPHERGAATPTSGEEESTDPQDARARDEAGTGWEQRKEPQQQPRSLQPSPVVPPPPPSRPLPLRLQQRSGAVAGPTASSQDSPPLQPVTTSSAGAGSGAGEGGGNPHEGGAATPIWRSDAYSEGEESTDPRDARARDEAGTGWEQRKEPQQQPPRSPQPSPVVPPPPPSRPLPLGLQQRSGAVAGPAASSQETPPLPPVTSPGAGAGSGAGEGGGNPHEGGAATPTSGEEESRDPQDARARDEAGTGWEQRKGPQQQQPRSVQPSPVVPPPPPSRPLPLRLQQRSGAAAGPTASSQETPPLPPVTSPGSGAGWGAGEGGRNPHERGAATHISGGESRDPQDARARDEAGTGWGERKGPQQQQPRSLQPSPVVPPPPPSRPLPLRLQQQSGAVAGPTASSQETPPSPPLLPPRQLPPQQQLSSAVVSKTSPQSTPQLPPPPPPPSPPPPPPPGLPTTSPSREFKTASQRQQSPLPPLPGARFPQEQQQPSAEDELSATAPSPPSTTGQPEDFSTNITATVTTTATTTTTVTTKYTTAVRVRPNPSTSSSRAGNGISDTVAIRQKQIGRVRNVRAQQLAAVRAGNIHTLSAVALFGGGGARARSSRPAHAADKPAPRGVLVSRLHVAPVSTSATAADMRSAADMSSRTAVDAAVEPDGCTSPDGSGSDNIGCSLASASGTGRFNLPSKNGCTNGGGDGVGFERVHVTDPGPTTSRSNKRENDSPLFGPATRKIKMGDVKLVAAYSSDEEMPIGDK